jgi:hypothetical protein
MKLGTFLIVLIIVIMGFSVYAYKLRTAYNVDARDEQIETLERDVAVLSYAMSIVPKEIKGDVFFNSIKVKFPSVEDNDGIIDLVRMKKPEKAEADVEEKTEEKKEKRTLASTMGDIL